MATPDAGVPVEVLRDAVRQHVHARTQRVVAGEIGLSIGWLDGFLNGATPRASTRRRLVDWYVRVSANNGQELSQETARAALELLGADLTPASRTRLRAELLTAITAAYSADGRKVPAWVAELRKSAR